MAKGNIKAGTFTGTGAAINLQLGFLPDWFMAWNVTDGDVMHFWEKDMAAGTTTDINTAVAGNADNGVTLYTGTRGANSAGLTIGSDLSESAKVYSYIAVANQ